MRARKLRPGMVLLTRDDWECCVAVVSGGAVLLTDDAGWRQWYNIWFILSRMRLGHLRPKCTQRDGVAGPIWPGVS